MTGSGLSRRRFAACACCAVLGTAATSLLGSRTTQAAAAHAAGPTFRAEDVLALLREGNEAFVKGAPSPALVGPERRQRVAKAQHPIAAILGCADSRVAPEVLFGKGIGEIFTVRVAGNTVDDTALGSLEYATAMLSVPVILVLGHERCGAVAAACEVVEKNTVLPGAIAAMVQPILPAALAAKSMPGDMVDNAIDENVRRTVERLRRQGEIIPPLAAAGKVTIVGGRYDLDDGTVRMLHV